LGNGIIIKKVAILAYPLGIMGFFTRWIKNFFGFSRAQVNGFIILLPLMAIILFSEPLWHWWMSNRTIDHSVEYAKLDSLVALWQLQKVQTDTLEQKLKQSVTFFPFDPNQSAKEDFMALGVPEKVSARIVNYRQKGGKFKLKSDLLKIYGFDSTLYHRLNPYIKLSEKDEKKFGKRATEKFKAVAKVSAEEDPISKFDLNMADTAQLKTIFGIGEKLSMRIIKYRDKLGGFVSMNQLKEVYGLDSVVISELKQHAFLDEKFDVKKIDINTFDEKQLASHPYFTKTAKSIVAYRFQHGKFKTPDDIRNVGTLDEHTIQKIIPYLQAIE
jgi:competence protein ComEA